MKDVRNNKRKRNKYRNIVAICCGLAGAAIGISFNTSGVFYTPVSENLGILRGAFSMHMTIFTLVMATASLSVPKIMKIIPYKVTLITSVLIVTVTTAMMGMARNIVMFYVLGAVRGLFNAMFSIAPISIIINRWFIRKNGLVMSVVFSISGLVGVFVSPVLAMIIEKWGWETGYFVKAGILFCLALPAMIYKFKVNPLEEQFKPYGEDIPEEYSKKNFDKEKKEDAGNINVEKASYTKLTFKSILLFTSFICLLTGFPQHFPGYSASLGYRNSMGAILLSAGMMGNIISKLLVGILSDRIGASRATAVLLISNLSGIIFLITANTFFYLAVGAFLFGSCYGIGAVALSLLTRRFFGIEKYIVLFPIITFLSNAGSALSLSIIGFIYDFSGSYMLAFVFSLVIIGISTIFLGIAIVERRKIITN